MKRFYEEGKLSKEWIELYCKGDWESCIRYEMEEKGEYHPDYMLPDGSIDKKLQKECKEIPMQLDELEGGLKWSLNKFCMRWMIELPRLH